MKILIVSVLSGVSLIGANALAHDIHNVASDHFHPGPVYTHSVSSAYDHHYAHQYNNRTNQLYGSNHHYTPYNYRLPKVTTNTSTYYTRSYPVKNTYTYLTTPNTTIHHPPYAYSSCANNCNQAQRRITVSRNLGSNTITYRAPSEYSAQDRTVLTPRSNYHPYDNRFYRTNTHVSPFKKHQLTTTTCYNC